VSFSVQRSPSSQALPSTFGGLEQIPVSGSQLPASWQASSGKHESGVPLAQLPAWHESLCVHASPSLHGAPSTFGGSLQSPVCASQVPASWQSSSGVHTTGGPLMQPPWQ
jgi:hypothetical protein